MFGSYGLYLRGIFIGLISGSTLYFKVDEKTQPEYEEAGSKPFTYLKKGKTTTLPFWEVPAEAMDDPNAIIPWITAAYAAALRRKKKQ